MKTLTKKLTGVVIGAGLILLIPLIAMQFTAEVNWNLFDFIVMGTLLVVTGFSFVFATRNVTSLNRRLLIGIMIAIGFFLVWAELAVGIFGSPFAGS